MVTGVPSLETDQVAAILLPFASHAEKIMIKPNEGTNTSYNHNFKIMLPKLYYVKYLKTNKAKGILLCNKHRSQNRSCAVASLN